MNICLVLDIDFLFQLKPQTYNQNLLYFYLLDFFDFFVSMLGDLKVSGFGVSLANDELFVVAICRFCKQFAV